MNRLFRYMLILSLLAPAARAETSAAFIEDGRLILRNDRVKLVYLWQNGALAARSLEDLRDRWSLAFEGREPSLWLGAGSDKPLKAELRVEEREADALLPAHAMATVEVDYGSWQSRRVFRLFPGSPLIKVENYLRGSLPQQGADPSGVEAGGVESASATEKVHPTRMESLGIQGPHWSILAVEFDDVTDDHNNLVREQSYFAYRRQALLPGNVFIAEDRVSGKRIVLVKEAPLDEMQLEYLGHDLSIQRGKLELRGLGLTPADAQNGQWVQAYGYAIGTGGDSELASLKGLREYLQAKRVHSQATQEMIMANTWGDRSRDQRMTEDFVLGELEAGRRLGITHLQLDDGWQAGLSKNSGDAAGRLWESWEKENWLPHPDRFPNGLAPVVEKAQELGVELGLWFHPSVESGFSKWEQDAEIIVDLYRRHGIRYFKLDGIALPTKEADRNLRRMLTTVMEETDGAAFFNLDATAGRRTGYFYLNEYGNIFLENRYTDWGNYYPADTLRNLWMLSKYVPPETLQIEFLNKWRNAEQYPPNDPLAPGNYSFDYLFAIAMMAQPLAWMEVSSLPDEAFAIAPMVEKYRHLMEDLHGGAILPIGEMPDGFSWTGFQSLREDRGYFLVFREKSEQSSATLSTWLEEGEGIRLTPVLPEGPSVDVDVGAGGRLEFSLPRPDSYCLYRYERIR